VAPDGTIAGALGSPDGTVAVRWPSAAAAPVALTIAGSSIAEARAISGRGDIVGRATLQAGPTHAFVAAAGGAPALLPHLAGQHYAEAYDVSSAGIVVGTAAAGGGEAHAVAWIDGAIVDLNTRVTLPASVRYLSSAVGITDRGVIAAEAVMTSGAGDAIRHLAILTPE
jgi:probable HAF family extracellular repeat protein